MRVGTLWPTACFINEVLLEHSHAHWLQSVYDCFPATKAELSGCNRNHVVCKALSIYYVAFRKKKSADLCSRKRVLKLEHAPESPTELVNAQIIASLSLPSEHLTQEDWGWG